MSLYFIFIKYFFAFYLDLWWKCELDKKRKRVNSRVSVFMVFQRVQKYYKQDSISYKTDKKQNKTKKKQINKLIYNYSMDYMNK